MTIEVKVPQLPESVTDATLIAWHKAPGDAVRRDESLVELETDKVVLEVPSPVNGVIKELRVANGTTVKAGELLAVLEEGEAKAAAAPAKPAAAAAAATARPAVPAQPAAATGRSAGKAGPAARRAASESGVDLAAVGGSGREGRVLKSDVAAAAATAGAAPAAVRPATAATGATGGSREERRIPMSRLRARIAQRMVEAQQNAAMLTTFNEVDLSAVIALRNRYRDAFEKQHGVKLGFMSFFVRACINALGRYPVVNASVEGNDIIHHDYYDIGIAVSTERGLIVPVVRDADQLSFAQIEAAINDYGRRAREGSIGMEDLTGGTFTITNGGIFGSMLSTPILNPPQSAILGMHKIQERAMVVDGQVVVRPMMYLALTYDHRIIDGREAVQFLVAVKDLLEDPGRLLLQV
ncbi:MAG: 2-oxoglutarate dehydrogenase complex dihydrolipoyllysine-residue succinyltransferase [Proteobacteria bacterium]|nr:MAG: 2-oxoglutarate dehydrogenase complex dihydrolipoyllysine-residue succinyltransferase [Pseudomonadota bacterium]MBC6944062.1 2-oxoglutarate dehydrogenase complex dihydrolipoyllysine-residue succinyltransferase [Gammaproteobacteria bacterium]MCQ3934926.1 dihydrolipoamide succinyltransferase [Gammaproteobacteria bacterium]MDL1880380.1 2-oxoglutarate dehydrogenase complex dihydrolipoyllysine-residue succinyltransferase [Gammaproteobacteria bacterium PRO2]